MNLQYRFEKKRNWRGDSKQSVGFVEEYILFISLFRVRSIII